MVITDKDVEKIRMALKPDFDNQTAEIKKYIHEGVKAVVEGVDNLLNQQDLDSRVKNLEKIHPEYKHLAD